MPRRWPLTLTLSPRMMFLNMRDIDSALPNVVGWNLSPYRSLQSPLISPVPNKALRRKQAKPQPAQRVAPSPHPLHARPRKFMTQPLRRTLLGPQASFPHDRTLIDGCLGNWWLAGGQCVLGPPICTAACFCKSTLVFRDISFASCMDGQRTHCLWVSTGISSELLHRRTQ